MTLAASTEEQRLMPNPLRGEFATAIAGRSLTFDTTLGTIVRIEEGCGARSIMDVVNGVVFGRRATDQQALIAAALTACGHPATLAAAATVPEAEAFILALMGALGFKLARAGEGEAASQSPLDASSSGVAGAPLPSAD